MKFLTTFLFIAFLAELVNGDIKNLQPGVGVGTTESNAKIVLLSDTLGLKTMSGLHRKLVDDRQISAARVEMLHLVDESASRESQLNSLRHQSNLIVVSPKEEYARYLSKQGFSGTSVVLAHGPWVDGRFNNWSESRSSRSFVISTHLDSDIACLNWMQLVIPNVKSIGVLAYTYTSPEHIDLLTKEASELGIKLVTVRSSGHDETMNIFNRAKQMNVDAWYVPHTPAAWQKSSRLIKLLRDDKIPAAFEYSHHYTKLGGLMSCGTDFNILDTAADAIQHLLVSPSSMLTNEYRPTDLSVSWNLTTAEQLGVFLPNTLAWRVSKMFR